MKRSLLRLLVAASLLAVAHTKSNSGSSGSSSSSSDSLRFLVLGDWGKGNDEGDGKDEPHDEPKMQEQQKQAMTTVGSASDNGDSTGTDAVGSSAGGNIQLAHGADSYQTSVAAAMGSYCSSQSSSSSSSSSGPACSFVVTVGDNFYDDGVASVTDSLWTSLWSDVYLQYSALNVPWYPTIGNHDRGGGSAYAEAQVARTTTTTSNDDTYNTGSGLWQMPAYNYSKSFSFGSNGGTVAMVFIDTTTLAPSLNRCCNSEGGVSSNQQAALIADQLAHIERMLQQAWAAQCTWLVVVGHYPVFSQGEHLDSSELISCLQPLLKTYKVHAYLTGHDHFNSHLSYGDTQHFIVGAGSMTGTLVSTSKASTAASLKWAGEGYCAFGSVLVSDSALNISYVNTNGQTTYSYALTNPFTWGPSTQPTLQPSSAPTFEPTLAPRQHAGSSPDGLTSVVHAMGVHGSHTEEQVTLGVVIILGTLAVAVCIYLCRKRAEATAAAKHVMMQALGWESDEEEVETATQTPGDPRVETTTVFAVDEEQPPITSTTTTPLEQQQQQQQQAEQQASINAASLGRPSAAAVAKSPKRRRRKIGATAGSGGNNYGYEQGQVLQRTDSNSSHSSNSSAGVAVAAAAGSSSSSTGRHPARPQLSTLPGSDSRPSATLYGQSISLQQQPERRNFLDGESSGSSNGNTPLPHASSSSGRSSRSNSRSSSSISTPRAAPAPGAALQEMLQNNSRR